MDGGGEERVQVLSCWTQCYLGQNRRRPAYWVVCNEQEAETVIDYLEPEKQQQWLKGRYKPDRNGHYYFLVDSARQFVLPIPYSLYLSGQHKAGHIYRPIYHDIQNVEDVWSLYPEEVLE